MVATEKSCYDLIGLTNDLEFCVERTLRRIVFFNAGHETFVAYRHVATASKFGSFLGGRANQTRMMEALSAAARRIHDAGRGRERR